jgi:GH15 family glucan-1,4-alpha-glucosidase
VLASARHRTRRLLGGILRSTGLGRFAGSFPLITALGVIGNRRTAAVVTAAGDIAWFCPGRFDAPSLMDALLDPDAGGSWRVDLPGATPARRRYLDTSAVLETTLSHPDGELVITDWMPLADAGVPHGAICRRFSAAPGDLRLVLKPRPDNGRRSPRLCLAAGKKAVIDARFELQASHPIEIDDTEIRVRVPKGEASWAVLQDAAAASVITDGERMQDWLAATIESWGKLAARASYDGAFAPQVHASLRALRLLTYAETGAVTAAVTTSLPEIVGGKRNFDYRYSWLRDSGITIRALVRFEPDGEHARRYLGYVAGLLNTGYRSPLDAVSAVGGERVPPQTKLHVTGYRDSRPVWEGNKAAQQLQLGSLANLILAAAEIYKACEPREHWEVVSAVADFLALHWNERGHGIWEQPKRRHFTESLVLPACALERIAEYATTEIQARRYRGAARDIRDFVARSCHTRAGSYAAVAGGDKVDISAALFPVWGYTSAADPAMASTIHEVEQQYGVGGELYHRHLLNAKAVGREGAFLAGTFWMAHYWISRQELEHGREIIETGLKYANDLGLFSEEINAPTGERLGNIPMALVHGSFLAAAADYHAATK